LSGILASAGVLVAAGAAASTILLPAGRARAAAMLLALVLFPLLILGDQWHSAQIVDLRDNSTRFAALALAALAAAAVLAAAFRRRPILLPLAIVFALPLRVPLHAGGDTANLLVPLYLVIAGGVISAALSEWQEGRVYAGFRRGDPRPSCPGFSLESSFCMRCRRSTRPTSPNHCRTSASSSCRFRLCTHYCEMSSGTGSFWGL
jgi:hypothetical protein